MDDGPWRVGAPLSRALLDCVARYKFTYVCMYVTFAYFMTYFFSLSLQ